MSYVACVADETKPGIYRGLVSSATQGGVRARGLAHFEIAVASYVNLSRYLICNVHYSDSATLV